MNKSYVENKSSSNSLARDIALGVAGFVGAVSAVVESLTPGKVGDPLSDGDQVFRGTYQALRNVLKINEEEK